MYPENGTKKMAAQIAGGVATAVLVAAGSILISTMVMRGDVDRAKADLADAAADSRELSATVALLSTSVATIQAERRVEGATDERRWARVERDLRKIREDQAEILRALPSSWRRDDD